jgi:hypothetical protein
MLSKMKTIVINIFISPQGGTLLTERLDWRSTDSQPDGEGRPWQPIV